MVACLMNSLKYASPLHDQLSIAANILERYTRESVTIIGCYLMDFRMIIMANILFSRGAGQDPWFELRESLSASGY